MIGIVIFVIVKTVRFEARSRLSKGLPFLRFRPMRRLPPDLPLAQSRLRDFGFCNTHSVPLANPLTLSLPVFGAFIQGRSRCGKSAARAEEQVANGIVGFC